MKVLIIIPAYNEGENILNTLADLHRYHPEYDAIVINDASIDNTKEILLNSGDPFLDLPINLGIGGGVQAGYLYAYENGYDIAVQMDGDGQHCASELDKIIGPVADGKADMTVGSRFLSEDGFRSTFFRRIGISFLSFLIKVFTGQKIFDVTSGFRCVNKDYIKKFSIEYAQDYPEPEAIVFVAKSHGKVMEVAVQMRERKAGTSSISFLRSIYYMIKVSLAIILYSLSKR